jgi:hypothetical protein
LHDESRIDTGSSTSESAVDSVASASADIEVVATKGTDVNAVMNANVAQQVANRNKRELKAAAAKNAAVAAAAAKAEAVANKAAAKAEAAAKAKVVAAAKGKAYAPAKAKEAAFVKNKANVAENMAAAGRVDLGLTAANNTASVLREGLRSSHSLATSCRKRRNEESMSAQDPNAQECEYAELIKQFDETKSEMKVRLTLIMLVLYFD